MSETGRLSVIATPIGNLEDITLRALRVLKEVDYILCEDTRVTGKLLKHYEIDSNTRRYDSHTPDHIHEEILTDLRGGKHIALVSDAGTPGVSDPGVLLIQKIYNMYPTVGHPMSNSSGSVGSVQVDVIPGPSAVTAAFSIAGLMGNQFMFLGFVPHKKGRETFFNALENYTQPVMFFESTHRIMKTLDALCAFDEHVEESHTIRVTICRELTKLHEEVVKGAPSEVRAYFQENKAHQKGEFVVIVST